MKIDLAQLSRSALEQLCQHLDSHSDVIIAANNTMSAKLAAEAFEAADLTALSVEEKIAAMKAALGVTSDRELIKKMGLHKSAVSQWRARNAVPPKFSIPLLWTDKCRTILNEWSTFLNDVMSKSNQEITRIVTSGVRKLN